MSFPVPKPVFKKDPYPKVSKAQRMRLLNRCGGLCEVCGKPPDRRGLGVSHEDAKGMGGTRRIYEDKDLKMRCGKCHSLRHHIYET